MLRHLAPVLILLCTGSVHASVASARSSCSASAEAAAVDFVKISLVKPQDSVVLLAPKSLATFRARLAQLLDDRYAPDSAELRRRLGVEHLASSTGVSMSDAEFVGAYFAAGAARAAPVALADVLAVGRRTEPYLGEAITVRYQLSTQGRETAQERTYYLSQHQGCWRLDVPLEAHARLEQLAQFLKESRIEPQFPAGKTPRLALRVAPASGIAFPSSTRFATSANMGAPVWVADAALLSEKDLDGASAYWDCNLSGHGPEDAAVRLRFRQAAAARLADWSAANIGSMLAVVLDGEVVTYAKVTGKLGDRLSICLPGKRLEQVREVASRVAG